MKHPILLLFLFALLGCRSETQEAIRTEDIQFVKEGELTVTGLGTTTVKASFDIEIAETPYETQTGLMYRTSMEKDQGMLFIFPEVAVRSFHMKNTEIPLDILFINSDRKIVSMHKNARPLDENGLSSQYPIQYVLEINAGQADTLGLAVGDRISYTGN